MEEYRRWEDNIKMELKEIGVDVISYLKMEITAGLVNAALNLQVS